MKQVILFLSVIIGAFAQSPPIWSVTGGPIGVGSCYDIVTESISFPVFNWHYDTQNTMEVRGQTYLIPDEVFGYAEPVYTNDSRILILTSYDYYFKQYISSWSITAGVTIDGVNLDGAFSHTKGQIDTFLNNSINFMAENVVSWNEFTMEVWPDTPLNPHFLNEVNKLPKVYNAAAYLQFIQYFGTHVITKSSYGGLINLTSIFHSDLVQKKSIEWVENQIKLTIGWMAFKAGMNWNTGDNVTQVDNTFLENAQNVTIVQGGEPEILQSQGFEAWFQTVLQNYAVLFSDAVVKPLFSVIPDPVIANNLKTATIAYGNGKLSKSKINVNP